MSRRSVALAAGFLMVAMLLSRILGFVREMAVTQVFGRTATTDAFFAAFAIPDLMYNLLVGGALGAAFIPVFTEYLARGQEKEAWYVASSFLNVIVSLLLLFAILGVIFAPALAPLVAYEFKGEQLDLLVFLMRIMFPAVFFTALAGLEVGILNSYQKFKAAAIAPLLYNIAIILGAFFLGPRMGITGLAIGVVVGAILNFSTQLPFVLRQNAGYRLLLFDFQHPGFRKMISLMLPTVIGLSVVQVNLLVNQNLASGLAAGSITALRLANRLMQLPLAIFAMAVATAIFPTVTRQVALGEMRAFRETMSLGLRSVFFITLPAGAGLIALAAPIVRLLFERGEFTAFDTQATAYALIFYSLGLAGQSAIQIITRSYYALQDTRTPVIVALFSALLNIVLSIVFLNATNLAHGGLALAYSATSAVNMLALFWLLRVKLHGIDGRRLLISFMKAAAASAVMAVAVWWVAEFLGRRLNLDSLAGRTLQVGAGILVGVVVYVLAVVALRMEEVRTVRELFLRRRRREPEAAN